METKLKIHGIWLIVDYEFQRRLGNWEIWSEPHSHDFLGDIGCGGSRERSLELLLRFNLHNKHERQAGVSLGDLLCRLIIIYLSGPEIGQVVSYPRPSPMLSCPQRKILTFIIPERASSSKVTFPPLVSDRENCFSSIITKAAISGLHVYLFLSLTLEYNGRKTTTLWLL